MIGCIGMIAPRHLLSDEAARLRHADLQTALDCATLIDPAGASGAGYTRCRYRYGVA